jgi:CheY-like chemotaxis protein
MVSILVVDDEPAIRRLLRLTLGTEYDVEEAEDGGEALRHLYRARTDIVLLDVAMPVMDGLAVCRAARAEPSLDRLGIIIVSAYSDRDEALEAGADRYFSKPYRPLALLETIDELVALQRGNRDLTYPNRDPIYPATSHSVGRPLTQ